ncbi:zinc finger MYM-type protein 1-like [Nasonia vitripennis]|uniref:DUF4371 domain-containing protein n=1 Tax=Nasonia vitripennis TaxID=7425 RepID=A0A7M7T7X3_NASVI|nr:zinc finger MYM-type protein 1-like [Nasonia vitripennis]
MRKFLVRVNQPSDPPETKERRESNAASDSITSAISKRLENNQASDYDGKQKPSDSLDKENDFESSQENVSSQENQALPKPKVIENWRKTYTWITINASNKVVCSICMEAVTNKLLILDNKNIRISKMAFVEEGYGCWKNAVSRFKNHEKSELHLHSIEVTLAKNNKRSIIDHLSLAKKKEMIESRTALTKIFTTVLVLAKQGLALRGHDEDRSNLLQFLHLRAEDVPELKSWLQRTGHKWVHHSIIDEIIVLYSENLLNIIVNEIKCNKYYSIMIDETSDVSRLGQVSICLRTVSHNFVVKEHFMEFCNTGNTKSETLLKIVTEYLAKITLSINDLRGQCYDGASNVSGKITGLQTRIRELEPRALFVHCSAHSLNLVVQDALEDIQFVRNFIGMIKEIINCIRDSPKRLHDYKILQESQSQLSVQQGNYLFSDTLWVMRIKSLKTIHTVENYKAAIEFFNNLSTDRNSDPSNSSKAKVQIVTENIKEMRNSKFDSIWKTCTKDAQTLNLDEPTIPRTRKISKRLDSNQASVHLFETPEQYYRKQFYEIVDKTLMALSERIIVLK